MGQSSIFKKTFNNQSSRPKQIRPGPVKRYVLTESLQAISDALWSESGLSEMEELCQRCPKTIASGLTQALKKYQAAPKDYPPQRELAFTIILQNLFQKCAQKKKADILDDTIIQFIEFSASRLKNADNPKDFPKDDIFDFANKAVNTPDFFRSNKEKSFELKDAIAAYTLQLIHSNAGEVNIRHWDILQNASDTFRQEHSVELKGFRDTFEEEEIQHWLGKINARIENSEPEIEEWYDSLGKGRRVHNPCLSAPPSYYI